MANLMNASADSTLFSRSLLSRRHLPSQANVLSTVQRIGKRTQPTDPSGRRTMVNSHFGRGNVTPGVIASNPANFTSGGLLYNSALNVPGHPAMINNSPTRGWINGVLAQGGTVIVGMYISSGGTHFVVLVAQNGAYDWWINDPWEENAMHVSYLSSPVTGPIYTAIGYL